jgi:hypothetical protein
MQEVLEIGDKIDFDAGVENHFAVTFLPLDIFDDWERGGKMANFIAEYFRPEFGEEESLDLISTVSNELIENAVKFSKNNSTPVELTIRKRGGALLIRAENSIPRHRRESFLATCKELFESDLEELYLRRIEESFDDPESSQIGLILMKKDYDTQIQFEFLTDEDQGNRVAVTLELAVK